MNSCLTQILTMFTIGWLAFVGVRSEITNQRPAALPLVNTYDQSPTAFSFQYPADWLYFVPEQGLLILGPPTANQNEVVPTLTVLRSQRLSSQAANLEEAMAIYLRRGPLLPGQAWEIVADTSPTTLDGRPALMIELEGANRSGDPPQHILAVITQADNSTFYILAAGAPLAEWQTHAPTLQAILASVNILE